MAQYAVSTGVKCKAGRGPRGCGKHLGEQWDTATSGVTGTLKAEEALSSLKSHSWKSAKHEFLGLLLRQQGSHLWWRGKTGLRLTL